MADNKQTFKEDEKSAEEPEVLESSHPVQVSEASRPQESLRSQQHSEPQQSIPQQISERSSTSDTSSRDTPMQALEQPDATINPAKLTVEEQIAYLINKYSSMEVPVCYIDAMPRRPSPQRPPQSQPPSQPRLHNRVPSLGSPERKKLYFKHPYTQISSRSCQQQHSSPQSTQETQPRSSQEPPSESQSDLRGTMPEWLAILKRHEKEQKKIKKEREEKIDEVKKEEENEDDNNPGNPTV